MKQKAKEKPLHKLSIYRRTLFLMVVAILFILLVLAMVYSLLYSRARIKQLEIQLLSSAQATAERVESSMDPEYKALNSHEEIGYLAFTARSSESIVWLVNSEGRIIYYSALPSSTREKLAETNEDDALLLNQEILNKSAITSQGRTIVGDYNGLLPDREEWISVSYPLSRSYGYTGEVILHYSLGENQYSFIRQETSLWSSFVIAFLVAVIIIVLLSRNITKPISKIVKAADDVYHGNLQTRVILGNEEPLYIHETSEYKEDDLMILVRTMNTMISKWEKQEHERDDLMTSISHDLRTPLTSIKGFLGAIQDGTIPPEKTEHYLNIVYLEVDRLQKLIENLFASTTIDKQNELNITVFDIEILMDQVISSLDSMITQKSININLDCQLADDETMVMADRDKIQRVIYNILSNAVKFTPERGFIRVEILPKTEKLISIAIEDNGEGVAKEDRQNIFNRFYKVNKSRNSEGSGMGLYIARTLLALHGQNIQVGESSLGGARFTFTLEKPSAREI